MDKSKKVRITIDLSPADYARLEKLQQNSTSAKAEIIRDAIRSIKYISDNLKDNWKVVLQKDNKEKELVLFL